MHNNINVSLYQWIHGPGKNTDNLMKKCMFKTGLCLCIYSDRDGLYKL